MCGRSTNVSETLVDSVFTSLLGGKPIRLRKGGWGIFLLEKQTLVRKINIQWDDNHVDSPFLFAVESHVVDTADESLPSALLGVVMFALSSGSIFNPLPEVPPPFA